MGRVGAVVVSFQPDLSLLRVVLEAAIAQVDQLWVVDNSGAAEQLAVAGLCAQLGARFLGNRENCGLAAAQNQGIRAVLPEVDAVLLLDQDTILPAGAVAELRNAMARFEGRGVGAVGPAFHDERRPGLAPFIRTRFGWRRKLPARGHIPVEVDYVIASGSLLSRQALDQVGLMDESLFIDYLDIEWGLRAQRCGFSSFGIPSVSMRHSLGEKPQRFLGLDWPMHSPLRHYYLIRNAVLLYRRRAIPLGWKIGDVPRTVLRFVFYSLVPANRWAHVKMMLRGLWHGVIGRSGRYEN